MSSNKQTYHFGRLHLIGQWDNKREFILQALKSSNTETQGKFKYGIFDVRELSLANEEFVFGRVVKYKDVLEAEVVDEESKQLVEGGLGDGVVSKSNFFLHFRTSSIAYNPIPNRISDRQFREMFVKLLKKGQGNFFFDGDMETIDEDIKIRDAIFSLDKIEKIALNIFPTNPSARDSYKILDERLRELKAKRLQQTLYARENGFDKQALEHDDTFRGIIMASDGYGEASVHGIKDNRKMVIYTNQAPILKEVEQNDDPEIVLEQLIGTFRQIWARIDQ